MFATIKINDKDVQLKASLFSSIYYNQVFGKNLMSDIVKIETLGKKVAKSKDPVEQISITEDIYKLSYQVIWALAKEGNNNIPAFEIWLKNIEKINLNEVMGEVVKLILSVQKISSKNV